MPFAKYDVRHRGWYGALMQAMCARLLKEGVSFWNYEQDLGSASLGAARERYCPCSFLRMYRVS
jgi:hypothetical protein